MFCQDTKREVIDVKKISLTVSVGVRGFGELASWEVSIAVDGHNSGFLVRQSTLKWGDFLIKVGDWLDGQYITLENAHLVKHNLFSLSLENGGGALCCLSLKDFAMFKELVEDNFGRHFLQGALTKTNK